jgi:hypothetical protein
MKYRINGFLGDESGAVTVDWVVMTAAVVGLGMAAALTAGPGMGALATKISDTVGAIELGVGGGGGEGEEITGIGPNPDKRGIDYLMEAELGHESWIDGMAADAPVGYNFDTPIIGPSDHPVYASNDGTSYSMNGQVYAADDLPVDDFWRL